MIEIQYDRTQIRATCTPAGAEFLISTEIQLSSSALLCCYRHTTASAVDVASLEREAAAEATARVQAMQQGHDLQ